MAAVIFTVDAESATEPVPDEEVAEAALANPDVLIPFASIDPFRGRAGIRGSAPSPTPPTTTSGSTRTPSVPRKAPSARPSRTVI